MSRADQAKPKLRVFPQYSERRIAPYSGVSSSDEAPAPSNEPISNSAGTCENASEDEEDVSDSDDDNIK